MAERDLVAPVPVLDRGPGTGTASAPDTTAASQQETGSPASPLPQDWLEEEMDWAGPEENLSVSDTDADSVAPLFEGPPVLLEDHQAVEGFGARRRHRRTNPRKGLKTPLFFWWERQFCVEWYLKEGKTKNWFKRLIPAFKEHCSTFVRHPCRKSVKLWVEKFRKRGTVRDCHRKNIPNESHSGRKRTVRTEANRELVRAVLLAESVKKIDDPTWRSLRKLENDLNISKTSLKRIATEVSCTVIF